MGQTPSKVKRLDATENELKASKLNQQAFDIADKCSQELGAFVSYYDKITKRIAMQSGRLSKQELSTYIQELQRAVQKFEDLNLESKYKKAQELRNRADALVGKNQFDYYESSLVQVRGRLNRLKEELNQATNKLYGKNPKEEQKEKQQNYQEEIDFLDEEIAKQEARIKAQQKDITLDDFLAEDETNSDSDDFLAEDEDDNHSDDFLADSNKEHREKNWKIEYRDRLQGVVALNGNVLIPFKKWKIEEYKNGIAKVSVVVDKMNLDCKGHPKERHVNPSVNKIGFVDKTGNYIGQDRIVSVSKLLYQGGSGGIIIYTSSVTAADKERFKARDKREKIQRLETSHPLSKLKMK